MNSYRKVTGENISTDIRNPISVALVSAKMIHDAQNNPKVKTVRGLPSDWVQCQGGWDGTNPKADLWDQAEQAVLARNITQTMSASTANYQVVSSNPVSQMTSGNVLTIVDLGPQEQIITA